jgi:aminoglycoside phosphotransferase (APT) family kinase protein
MLDYNTKFDRRESTRVLDLEEIRELVCPHLGGSEIESVSLLAGGFVNSNYRLVLRDHSSLVLRIAARPGELKKELRVLKHVHDTVPVPAVVSTWKVAGVLDWEFAVAGCPLVDIGNFLRFEHELPPGFSAAFIKGYLSNSIGLPGNWREVARLLDLAAMVNFLDSAAETPKSFRTAASVIAKTVGA